MDAPLLGGPTVMLDRPVAPLLQLSLATTAPDCGPRSNESDEQRGRDDDGDDDSG
jgi:hypothetical protein